jgi:hypothetical protein
VPWQVAAVTRGFWVKTKRNTNPDAEGEVVAIATDLPSDASDADPAKTRLLVRDADHHELVWVPQRDVDTKDLPKRPRKKVVAATAGASAPAVLQVAGLEISEELSTALAPVLALIAGYLTPPGRTG